MVLILSALLTAAPHIEYLHPNGATPGVETEVRVAGKDLNGARLLIPTLQIDVPTMEASRDRFRLQLPPDCPPGIHPAWIATPQGVSNAAVFCVDALPLRVKSRSNSEPETVELPCVASGVLQVNAIHEWVVVAEKGQRLSIDVWADRIGSVLDPRIVLLSRTGKVLAECDDVAGLGCDCRMTVIAAEAGPHTLQIHDSTYSMREAQPYRIRLGGGYPDAVFPLGATLETQTNFQIQGGTLDEVQQVAVAPAKAAFDGLSWIDAGVGVFTVATGRLPEVVFPADDSQPTFEPPVVVNGRLSDGKPVHRMLVKGKPGATLVCRVEAATLGSQLDAVLTASAPSGKRLEQQDDQFFTAFTDTANNKIGYSIEDPTLSVQIPKEGQLWLEVADRLERMGPGFAYRLTVLDPASAMDLRTQQSAWLAPLGGTVALKVELDRKGFNGPIRVSVAGLPEGWSAPPAVAPPGVNDVYLTVSIPEEAKQTAAAIELIGGPLDAKKAPIQRCRHEMVLGMERFNRRERSPKMLQLRQFAVVAGPKAEQSLAVGAPNFDERTTATFPLNWTGPSGVSFSALGLPPGIKADFDAAAATMTLSAEKSELFDQQFTFVVQAEWTHEKQKLSVAAPLTTFARR